MKKRVVIAGGGTGGHFYPGLVLAQTLRARGWESVTLVRKADPALALLEREGLTSAEVDVVGLPRRLSPVLLRFGWKLAGGFRLIGRILRAFEPDVVIGMGGYLTFPAVLAAAARRIPRAVHESNSILGLANKACLPLGAHLFLGLPLRKGSGGTLTGTPIRPALWDRLPAGPARRELGLDEKKATILVFGGSQGAKALNDQVPAALRAGGKRLQVLHLAGEKDAAGVSAAYAGSGVSAIVLPYLESMEKAYAAADLVICRSGASTLAELGAQGKPAILVPFPSSAAGHQEENARLFEERGAAKLLLQQDIETGLTRLISDILLSEGAPGILERMSQSCASLGMAAPADTASRLADAVQRLPESFS